MSGPTAVETLYATYTIQISGTNLERHATTFGWNFALLCSEILSPIPRRLEEAPSYVVSAFSSSFHSKFVAVARAQFQLHVRSGFSRREEINSNAIEWSLGSYMGDALDLRTRKPKLLIRNNPSLFPTILRRSRMLLTDISSFLTSILRQSVSLVRSADSEGPERIFAETGRGPCSSRAGAGKTSHF